jgi:hypothetical protein
MVNLTDLWRANGSPQNKAPYDWSRIQQTLDRCAHLAYTGIARESCFRIEKRGPASATWAHWKLAIDYAEYLSNECWSRCKDMIRAYVEGRHRPGLPPEVPRDALSILRLAVDALETQDKRIQTLELTTAALAIRTNPELFTATGYVKAFKLEFRDNKTLSSLGKEAAKIGKALGLEGTEEHGKEHSSRWGDVHVWPERVWNAALKVIRERERKARRPF